MAEIYPNRETGCFTYLSAGDNPYASGDVAYVGCSLCGREQDQHPWKLGLKWNEQHTLTKFAYSVDNETFVEFGDFENKDEAQSWIQKYLDRLDVEVQEASILVPVYRKRLT